jgi:hypothetical protein
LSLSEHRTINQQWWADEIGISQSQIGEVLKAMVNEHILERGPKEGTAHTYRVNPAYPGIQGVYNRKLG